MDNQKFKSVTIKHVEQKFKYEPPNYQNGINLLFYSTNKEN